MFGLVEVFAAEAIGDWVRAAMAPNPVNCKNRLRVKPLMMFLPFFFIAAALKMSASRLH